jgi:uncharacterized phage protein (TIGR02220 family)/predicted phage replisome organizer
MAEVKWVKICTDLFDDEKIILIESLPKADAIIVIWIKLLCLAGKQNNNGVFLFNEKIPYNDEMFAKVFRKNVNLIRMALKTFERFGMIEIIDNVVTIPNWEKHQSIDKLSGIREYNRIAQQKSRAKKKQLLEQNINEMSMTSQLCHDTDIDIDKDIDIYINVYKEIVNYLNDKAKTKYKPSTAKTKSHIKARLDEGFTLDDFKTVIDKKCAEWVGTEFEQYLRPETLFGTKFESYLNAKVVPKKDDNKTAIDEAKTDLDELF